jgi:peptidoglycan/LPS O-acetylase OafA/YrhL
MGALAGGVPGPGRWSLLLLNPGADLRLVRWLVGLLLAGWGVLRLVHTSRASWRDRTWLILSGLGALVAGIVVVAWPAITMTALVSILVVGGLSLAAVDLVGAVVNRRRDPGWWLSLLRGVGTLLLVVVLLAWPDPDPKRGARSRRLPPDPVGGGHPGRGLRSPIRDNAYRRQIDQEVRRII